MTCSVDLTSFGLLFDKFIRSAMRDESSTEYLLEGAVGAVDIQVLVYEIRGTVVPASSLIPKSKIYTGIVGS